MEAKGMRKMPMERNGHKIIDIADPIHTAGNISVPISLTMDDLEADSRLTIKNGDGSPGR